MPKRLNKWKSQRIKGYFALFAENIPNTQLVPPRRNKEEKWLKVKGDI
jgi:hypothetical protein